MWNYLKTIQAKPLHTRKVILHVSTVLIFSFIVLLWMLLLNIQKAKESTKPSDDILSPFKGIQEVLTNLFEGVYTTSPPAVLNGVNNNEIINLSPATTESLYVQMNKGGEMESSTVQDATGTPQ